MTTITVRPAMQERIRRIQAEISGVVAQSGVTSWELQFMHDLQARDVAFGSPKQLAIIERIERKVFEDGAS